MCPARSYTYPSPFSKYHHLSWPSSKIKSSGFSAVVRGKILHIEIKVGLELYRAQFSVCVQELPCSSYTFSWFLPQTPKTHTLANALFSSHEVSLQPPDSLSNVSPVIGSLATSCEAFGAAKLKVKFRKGLVLLREALIFLNFWADQHQLWRCASSALTNTDFTACLCDSVSLCEHVHQLYYFKNLCPSPCKQCEHSS